MWWVQGMPLLGGTLTLRDLISPCSRKKIQILHFLLISLHHCRDYMGSSMMGVNVIQLGSPQQCWGERESCWQMLFWSDP